MSEIPLRAAGVCASITAALILSPAPAGAQANDPGSRSGRGPHVRVELIADRTALVPGMQLGLMFSLDPGWHVYWQNPGDSGGPPEIAWTLPPGLSAAAIEWPAPERIDIGGLVNYGYHDRVLLPVTLEFASGARIPGAFTIKAAVRWMACADLCVPGRAELALRFPLGPEEITQVAGWQAAFGRARARKPVPAPPTWRTAARSSGDTFVVDIVTGAREEHAVFFPLEVSQVNDSAAQVVTPRPDGVRVTVSKSSQLVKDPGTLRGVITLSGGRSYTIEAPLR